MSIVMEDAQATLSDADRKVLSTVLYADDTLLVGSSQASLDRLLNAVAETGRRFGLELHWGKFQLLNVRCDYSFTSPCGKIIESKNSMGYLGTTLADDGGIRSEISRRLGMAWTEFSKLLRLWNHTSLALHKKVQVFNAIVTTKLLYGLSPSWLNLAERRRLNGFQCRCLRKI